VAEPYRMFTSRAEFRLSLRADNADERLTPLAIQWGVASKERQERFFSAQQAFSAARDLTRSRSLTPNEAERYGFSINRDGIRRTAYDLLSYPDVTLKQLAAIWPELGEVDAKVAERLETEARYAVYLDRQARDAERIRRDESKAIPNDIDFDSVPGLSNELKDKLRRRRPQTLAEAQRIDGMTPAALALILVTLRRGEQIRGAA